MKKNFMNLLVAVLILLPGLVNAQANPTTKDTTKEESKKLELKPYGFIKGDMVYATNAVTSFGGYNLGAPQLARYNQSDTSALGFTAQHTRFGLKGSVGDKTKVGGTIELDFFAGQFDANVKPRIRLAYMSISKGNFEARFGQQWDIFSPNNANTNNTNGNLWFSGNKGFRRPQIQLIYKVTNDNFAPQIQFSFGETTREDYITSTAIGSDNRSGIPIVQGRLSAKIKKKYEIGAYGAYASYSDFKLLNVTPTLYYNTTGFGIDFNLNFHKYFALNGEFNSGTNLNNANLFSIGGNHAWKLGTTSLDSLNQVFTGVDIKNTGYWFNATSKISDKFNVVIGYGSDNNGTAEEFLSVGSVEGNTVIYGDLIFLIKHGFSIVLEVQNIKTTYVTKVENKVVTARKDFGANVINLSAKVNF